jgi:hypothetical protein
MKKEIRVESEWTKDWNAIYTIAILDEEEAKNYQVGGEFYKTELDKAGFPFKKAYYIREIRDYNEQKEIQEHNEYIDWKIMLAEKNIIDWTEERTKAENSKRMKPENKAKKITEAQKIIDELTIEVENFKKMKKTA